MSIYKCCVCLIKINKTNLNETTSDCCISFHSTEKKHWIVLVNKSQPYSVLLQATPLSVRIRMEWIHLAEDYMDNMVQFAPNQGVDPALIHFDVNVYWIHSKSSQSLKDKLRKYFHLKVDNSCPLIRDSTGRSLWYPTGNANALQYIKVDEGETSLTFGHNFQLLSLSKLGYMRVHVLRRKSSGDFIRELQLLLACKLISNLIICK